MNISNKFDIAIAIVPKINIPLYRLNALWSDIGFLFLIPFIIRFENLIENKSRIVYIIISIIWCGKIYISANKQPFVLYCRMKDDIENPNIKVLEKYINIFNGIPITDIPNIHIVIIKIILDKNAFL